MIQRLPTKRRRQAGFIIEVTHKQQQDSREAQSRAFGLEYRQFSPFKSVSPEPIHRIIGIMGGKQENVPHRQTAAWMAKQFCKNEKVQEFQHLQHIGLSDEDSSDQSRNADKFEKIIPQIKKRSQKQEGCVENSLSAFIHTEEEQVVQIPRQPNHFGLTLAESFDLNCAKLKQRLQKRTNNSPKVQQGKALCNSHSSNFRYLPQSTKKISSKIKENEGAERLEDQSNCTPTQCTQKSSQSFFIPALSSKSRPITPRQAYQRSLRKWKRLPEVIAREHEKAKKQAVKQRQAKVKALCLSIRKRSITRYVHA